MIRPLTLACLLAAGGAGLYLYQVKHSVSLLDRELRDVRRQIDAARERTQVLRAEWALLNEPDRLRQVAERHLTLVPLTPAQFVRPQELDRRLPAPVAFAGTASLFAPPPGETITAEAGEGLPPVRPAAAVGPSQTSVAPATAAATTAPRVAEARPAPAAPPPRPAASPRPSPSPQGAVAAVAAPVPANPAIVRASASARAVPPPPAPPAVSALGGAQRQALAPPVPFGASPAAAATLPPPTVR